MAGDEVDPDAPPADRYFPPSTRACPTFVDDSEWLPLVDGATYLAALGAVMRTAGPGDAVTIVGLELDPALDLDGHAPGDPGYRPLGDLLADLADRGIEVRVVLAFRVLAASVPVTLFGGFRATGHHAEVLRRLEVRPGVTPLAGRVLLDHSGALLGSNHQKAVALRIGGEVTGFVGGIDLVTDRFDAAPHDRLRLDGRRWGWHDMAVRIRGRAAGQVWHALQQRWIEASTLPQRRYVPQGLHRALVNPDVSVPAPPHVVATPVRNPGVAVRVLRSVHDRKTRSVLPSRRLPWLVQPSEGVHEIHETLVHAISAARRYVYIEDQYLAESAGGSERYELYPALVDAAGRGVKVILLGSGTRDPEDAGFESGPINRRVNPDVRTKLVEPLDAAHRDNIAYYRVEHLTVHAKLVLIDDRFASIGSANMFSRSMAGIDCEINAAVATTTPLVRDLRVAVWGEHLRVPVTDGLRDSLADLDTALGIWRSQWSPSGDPLLWRAAGRPAGFVPAERVLRFLGP